MRKIFNKRPSPAMIVAFIALFVAMSGVGYTAKKLNGKRIKSRSIAGSKMKRDTITGTEVNESKLALPYDLTSAIPSGKTIKGAWGGQDSAAGATAGILVNHSFPAPAPVGLRSDQVNFAASTPGGKASDPDPACAGSFAAPTAPAGKVCLYVRPDGGTLVNVATPGLTGFAIGLDTNPSNTLGFAVQTLPAAAGAVRAEGTWAYTAP